MVMAMRRADEGRGSDDGWHQTHERASGSKTKASTYRGEVDEYAGGRMGLLFEGLIKSSKLSKLSLLDGPLHR